MNRKRNKKVIRGLVLLVAITAVCETAAGQIWQRTQKENADSGVYKTELVRRGSVSTGISESGTVEFGTTEQIFSVAEITEVIVSNSDTDADNGSDTASSAENFGMAGMSAEGEGSGLGVNMEMNSGGTSSSDAATGEASAEDTSLAVEEVYLATGQVVEKGDKILKIAQDSIDEYYEQLENAVKTAELKVSQEEINVESKKAEADYTYEMYLAKGETAEETYNATIARLETAVSDLEEELDDADEDDVEELEAELQIARNNLATQSIEAKQTYENAMTNYKYAQQLYDIDTNGLEDDLNEAKDTLEEANQNLADFEEQIGDGIVYAEYSGTVKEISYAAGDTLTNDSTVAVFTDSDNVTMTVSVSQEDISGIAVGDTVSINLTAYENVEFPGEVISISASAAAGSSTVNYDVEVRFTGDISKVYSGMTGEAAFTGKTVEDTLYISNRAVYQEGTRSYVKVQDEDGSIREVEIKTGFSNGNIVAVESGLEEGEYVVIESKVTG